MGGAKSKSWSLSVPLNISSDSGTVARVLEAVEIIPIVCVFVPAAGL